MPRSHSAAADTPNSDETIWAAFKGGQKNYPPRYPRFLEWRHDGWRVCTEQH